MTDDGHVAATAGEGVDDAVQRVEEHLGGVGDEEQVVVVVFLREVAKDAAGAAVFRRVALNAKPRRLGDITFDARGNRSGVVNHHANGQRLEF